MEKNNTKRTVGKYGSMNLNVFELILVHIYRISTIIDCEH